MLQALRADFVNLANTYITSKTHIRERYYNTGIEEIECIVIDFAPTAMSFVALQNIVDRRLMVNSNNK